MSARKTELLLIFVVVFIDLLGFGIVLPLLPRYGRYFAADKLTLGLLMASFSAMQFLFAPIWGRVSDRIGRRPVLLLGLAGSTVSYALFGAASSLSPTDTWLSMGPLTWLFITRIGAGIAGATIPTAQAYIADVTDEKGRGKGMALIGAAFGIGFTFGPLLGAWFVSNDLDAAPSAAPGYVASVLSALAFVAALTKLPESLRPDSAPAKRRWLDVKTLATSLKRPTIGLILATIFLTTFAFAQFESTLSLLTQSLGMAERRNFLLFAYTGFVLTIGQGLLVRRLIPKWGEYKMALIGCALMTAGLVLIGLVGWMTVDAASTDETNALGGLLAVLPIAVIGFSAVTPSLQSLLSLRSPNTEQGEILGVGQSMSALARILGPVAGIMLFDDLHPEWPYWAAGALMFIGLLMVVNLGRPQTTEA